MWTALILMTLAASASYFGPKFLLPRHPLVQCNTEIQAFDLLHTPVYWQVQEGGCSARDPNYGDVRGHIEATLRDSRDQKWPEAECSYVSDRGSGLVFKFGTDYYELEALDCLEPLRQMREEKENDPNVLGDIIRGVSKDFLGQGNGDATSGVVNLLMRAFT